MMIFGQHQYNPFLPNQGASNYQPRGLLDLTSMQGWGYRQPKPQDQYEQMASPYANWAAQQLQAVAPETHIPQQQWNDPQQQALAQMWSHYQNQSRNQGW